MQHSGTVVLPGLGYFSIVGTAIKRAGTTQKLVVSCSPSLKYSLAHIGITATTNTKGTTRTNHLDFDTK